MKLDEGIQDQKLHLDFVPLIDICFLLVLFFAVSTSFISAGDLTALRDNLVNLASDKETLNSEVMKRVEQITDLEQDLISANEETSKLEWMIATLESKQVELQDSLNDSAATRKSLEEQLEEAFRDYQSLNVQLDGLKSERDAQAEQERMLQNLLAEKTIAYRDLEVRLVQAGQENATLSSALTGLQGENQANTASLGQMRTEILRLQAELAKFKEVADLDREQVERILAAQQTLEAGLNSYLEDNKLGIKRERQRLVLQLSDQILFDSGSAEINEGGFEVLRTVGDIIRARIGNLDVQIGGHTDDVPVSSREGLLSTNWGLSAARAVNVVRFLEGEVGIGADRLSAVGYGEHRPVASNESAEGRAQNRRIEIVLVPR